ncbi:MAG: DUF3878 family protein [Clostridia bacterium]|nr:DUF3878 family protein [Clostridia bacterium]
METVAMDEKRFEADFSAVSKEARSALRALLDLAILPEFERDGSDVRVVVDDMPAFRRVLTLKNADAVPKDLEGLYCDSLGLILKKEEGRYCFYGMACDPEDGRESLFAMTFDGAEAEVEVYNACHYMTFMEDPWDRLQAICFSVGAKAELPGARLNESERELLPLIREIVKLEYWLEGQECLSFNEMKKAVRRRGIGKAEALLCRLEQIKPSDKRFYPTVKRLTTVLCEQKNAPLWQEIYKKLEASQAFYPDRVDSLCDPLVLSSLRQDIQRLMESYGYEGTYPDFHKDGALRGIHLAQSYGMTYFVGNEKHARYRIRCYESYDEETLSVQLLCGTAFLKKSEANGAVDLHDCLFNAKGHRLFHAFYYHRPLCETEDDAELVDLETAVGIAVKRTECQGLTKEERRATAGTRHSSLALFFLVFLIMGGLFGVMMTFCMMLICVLATAAFGLFASIPEMLQAIPWWWILAIAWGGFGGAMGVLEVLAQRK